MSSFQGSLQRVMSLILVICCCVFALRLCDIKQQTFISPQLLWIVNLSGSGSRSLMRRKQKCPLGLPPSEILTRAGWPASKLTQWYLPGGLSSHFIKLLECPYVWQLPFPRQAIQEREKGESHNAFYILIMEVLLCHSHLTRFIWNELLSPATPKGEEY